MFTQNIREGLVQHRHMQKLQMGNPKSLMQEFFVKVGHKRTEFKVLEGRNSLA